MHDNACRAGTMQVSDAALSMCMEDAARGSQGFAGRTFGLGHVHQAVSLCWWLSKARDAFRGERAKHSDLQRQNMQTESQENRYSSLTQVQAGFKTLRLSGRAGS